MFQGCVTDLLFAELLKDLTVVQKLVLGNLSTAVLSPLIAFVNFLLFVLTPSATAASPSTASESFLRVVATTLAAFDSFVPVPEAVLTAFVNSLLGAASLLTDSGNFLGVAATPLIVKGSSDPVLEPL